MERLSMYNEIVDAFLNMEKKCYPEKKFPELEMLYEEVKKYMEENCYGYTTLETITNMGQSSNSLTLDCYICREEEREKNKDKLNKSITILLCSCGNDYQINLNNECIKGVNCSRDILKE